jgi:hypothetical protein
MNEDRKTLQNRFNLRMGEDASIDYSGFCHVFISSYGTTLSEFPVFSSTYIREGFISASYFTMILL